MYRLSAKAIVIQDKKILLVKERLDNWWSMPGGGVNHSETASDAIRRELHEELGIEGSCIKIENEPVFVTIGTVVRGVPKVTLFYSIALDAGTEIIQTSEILDFSFFDSAAIESLFISPTLGDKQKLIDLLAS